MVRNHITHTNLLIMLKQIIISKAFSPFLYYHKIKKYNVLLFLNAKNVLILIVFVKKTRLDLQADAV